MSLIVSEQASQFEPAPEGLHQGICVDVVDLGMLKTDFGGKHLVRLIWQLPSLQKTGERHTVSQRYTVSLHKKAKLRQHLEMWRGKSFTPEELTGFDLEKLLGANGQLQVTHNVADEGRVYANVQAVVPCMPGTPRMLPVGYTRVKDRKPNVAGTTEDAEGDSLPF